MFKIALQGKITQKPIAIATKNYAIIHYDVYAYQVIIMNHDHM